MLRHAVAESRREATRPIMPVEAMATVGGHRAACNSSRWILGDGQTRRMRRRRRVQRSGPSPILGWTVKTW